MLACGRVARCEINSAREGRGGKTGGKFGGFGGVSTYPSVLGCGEGEGAIDVCVCARRNEEKARQWSGWKY